MRRCLALAALVASAAAHADHPLITEDTGVLGAGVWQIELHGERVRDGGARRTHLGATLGRGVTERLDLQLDLPYERLEHESGLQDVSLATKWRFFQRGGTSAMLKPELSLPTGREQDGLGAGRVGWSAGAALAQQWRSFELIGHLRYTANRNRVGEREALRHASAALVWSAAERLRLVLDYARDTSPDPARSAPERTLVLGALFALSDTAELGIGQAQGRSASAEDRSLRAGVKLRW
ncbi:MAG TPA: transporter [Burkholderiales bacterium]